MQANEIEMYAGDSKRLVFAITDEAGAVLDVTGATFEWLAVGAGGFSLTKQPTASNATAGEVTVELAPEDTASTSGPLTHELRMTDAIGNVSTVYYGKLFVKSGII